MKYIFLFYFILFFLSCNDHKRSKGIAIDQLQHPDSLKNELPYLWRENCKNSDFKLLFDCDNSEKEYYQIELFHDPFKDMAVMSLIFRNGAIYEIYVTRFHIVTSRNKVNSKRFTKKLLLIMPYSNDTLYCFYNKPKNVTTLGNVERLSHFFSSTLWTMPRRESSRSELDPETWTIKGRKNGEQSTWERHLSQDSVFYTNIQQVIDLCKIKDYKYKKR